MQSIGEEPVQKSVFQHADIGHRHLQLQSADRAAHAPVHQLSHQRRIRHRGSAGADRQPADPAGVAGNEHGGAALWHGRRNRPAQRTDHRSDCGSGGLRDLPAVLPAGGTDPQIRRLHHLDLRFRADLDDPLPVCLSSEDPAKGAPVRRMQRHRHRHHAGAGHRLSGGAEDRRHRLYFSHRAVRCHLYSAAVLPCQALSLHRPALLQKAGHQGDAEVFRPSYSHHGAVVGDGCIRPVYGHLDDQREGQRSLCRLL